MNKISGLSQKNSSKGISNKSDYPSVEELPTLGLTYSDLKRRVTVDEALWEAVNAQYESAKVQEAKDIPTVRVLDMANVPQHKSAPVRSYIVILGAVGSLFVACIFVAAISAWEAMDAQDERKKLVTEIVGTMRHSHKWLRWLPEARISDDDNKA
ncbi:MAG: GNVR domain-containing protein [Candidatus Pacebacteria bacterium]|nr:GNVR domain-containing protein [Candidatus Paceibacterota bacterium]